MKVLCIIDGFGSGGAQRQIVNLAIGLSSLGSQVEMFVYHPEQKFFRPLVEASGICIHQVESSNHFSIKTLCRLISIIRTGQYDASISFLGGPNLYSILAHLFSPGPRVIVSERSSHHSPSEGGVGGWIRLLAYGFADRLVANSYAQADWLSRYPWLRSKTLAIYNGYPIESMPAPTLIPLGRPSFLILGRVGPEKNALRLVEAMIILAKRGVVLPRVSWAGREDSSPTGRAYCEQIKKCLATSAVVQACWDWLGERKDVSQLLECHTALIHPSLYEGLPNAICEAFIAGRPVLASNVCDHPALVGEGIRGLLFDPRDPEDIASCIEKFMNTCRDELQLMGLRARAFAESKLSLSEMVSKYSKVVVD